MAPKDTANDERKKGKLSEKVRFRAKKVVQSSLSNTDTEGTERRVRIREDTMMASLLRPH